jgi:hypothetical protein
MSPSTAALVALAGGFFAGRFVDAGFVDGGFVDAGSVDGAFVDAGSVDGGAVAAAPAPARSAAEVLPAFAAIEVATMTPTQAAAAPAAYVQRNLVFLMRAPGAKVGWLIAQIETGG